MAAALKIDSVPLCENLRSLTVVNFYHGVHKGGAQRFTEDYAFVLILLKFQIIKIHITITYYM